MYKEAHYSSADNGNKLKRFKLTGQKLTILQQVALECILQPLKRMRCCIYWHGDMSKYFKTLCYSILKVILKLPVQEGKFNTSICMLSSETV